MSIILQETVLIEVVWDWSCWDRQFKLIPWSEQWGENCLRDCCLLHVCLWRSSPQVGVSRLPPQAGGGRRGGSIVLLVLLVLLVILVLLILLAGHGLEAEVAPLCLAAGRHPQTMMSLVVSEIRPGTVSGLYKIRQSAGLHRSILRSVLVWLTKLSVRTLRYEGG